MKIFIDTGNIREIEPLAAIGIIDGATTNPSLLAKEAGDYRTILKEICRIVQGPVSAEVVATDTEGMVRQGRELAGIDEHIVVKVPFGRVGLPACRALTREGIRVNVTLIFSPTQALLAAKVGAAYVSPFVGRLDDISHDGMSLVSTIVTMYGNYDIPTEVIVASVRNPLHVVEAAMMGAHIATVPYTVFKQMLAHPLTDKGIAAFLDDWAKVKGR